MTKRTKASIKKDKKIKALHAGKRTSEDGNVYYENRPNRSDVNRTKKFAKGGEVVSHDEIGNSFGSASLKKKLKSKIKEDDTVIQFSYSDYAGDFGDKVSIAYFKKNHPKNIVSETTGYNGEAAFVFGKPADGFVKDGLEYEDLEEFYNQAISNQEAKEFKEFLAYLKKKGYDFEKETYQYLLDERGSYYDVKPNGLDFSPEDLTKFLIEEGYVSEKFAKGGGVGNESKDIEKYKLMLISKAKSKGLYENFGQKEVRLLEDKYGNTNAIREFDNWASNYDLSKMSKGGGVGENKNIPEWAVTINSKYGKSHDWVGFAKDEDSALYEAEKEAGFESVESGINMITDKFGKKIEYAKGGDVKKSEEDLVLAKLDGKNEILCSDFENIIGRKPCYPVCHVGNTKLKKQFLRGCYIKI